VTCFSDACVPSRLLLPSRAPFTRPSNGREAGRARTQNSRVDEEEEEERGGRRRRERASERAREREKGRKARPVIEIDGNEFAP